MKLTEKDFDKLVDLYINDPACIAEVCDGILDKSGKLLGDVRNGYYLRMGYEWAEIPKDI